MNELNRERRQMDRRATQGVGRNIEQPRVFVGQMRSDAAAHDLAALPVAAGATDILDVTDHDFVIDYSAIDGADPIQ